MSEPARTGVAVTGAARIAYEVQGQGEPLLLLHGAEGTRHMFGDLVILLRASFTCISFDQRGCGETQAPLAPYTADDIADDACAVLAQAGFASAHVYGTSFGGIVAQSLAARHPACVRALVLGNTWASGQVLPDVSPAVARELAVLRQDRAANAQAIASFFYPQPVLRAHPWAVDRFRQAPATGDTQRLRAQCVATPVAAMAPAIAAPTLVVAGSEDRLVAADKTLALARLIPRASGRSLPGAGHLPALQMPAALAAEITGFLSTHPDIR